MCDKQTCYVYFLSECAPSSSFYVVFEDTGDSKTHSLFRSGFSCTGCSSKEELVSFCSNCTFCMAGSYAGPRGRCIKCPAGTLFLKNKITWGYLKGLMYSLIMVIELSGVQFGVKWYAWFQNRTSAQREIYLHTSASVPLLRGKIIPRNRPCFPSAKGKVTQLLPGQFSLRSFVTFSCKKKKKLDVI